MPKRKDFKISLAEKTACVNRAIASVLKKHRPIHPRIQEAMRYTLEAPGKRLRGALVLFCCELIKGKTNKNAEIAAAAIEMVHTYSLIHDDLPAMDNDDFRRGKPSCHKKFDEATAILTGDALLTYAFELLARQVDDEIIANKLIATLADASGGAGMIAGQMADLLAQNIQGNPELVSYIHLRKTARMFEAACAMGAITGSAAKTQQKKMAEFGLKIGLGFQIADDILDVTAGTEQLGKTAGKDAMQGKLTYPALIGLEESKKLAKKCTFEAIDALKSFGPKADILRQLAQTMLERTK